MSKIKLTGESSGYVEISAGNAAGNNTLEAPTSGTRLVAHEGSQDVTLNGNLTVNGVLSYEDTTNIDSVGVITARAGVHVTGGNLAVGHNNPSVNLHVKGSASNGQIYLGGTGAHSQIYADNDGVLILNADQGNSAANSYLGFNVDNSERLRITSDGKFGYGTATPGCFFEVSDDAAGATVQQKLINRNTAANSSTNQFIYVNNSGAGDPFTTWTVGGVTSWSMGIDNSDSDKLKIAAASNLNSNQYLTLDTSGNIGINEDNPQNALHISGSSPTIRFEDTGANGSAFSIIEDNDGLFKIRNDAGNSGTGSGIAFEVDAAEALRISSSGKIGINQSSPFAELDITSTTETTTGTLSQHGIRLSAPGAADGEVIPITGGFLSSQDRARAGIGFISRVAGSSVGYAGAIGFYTRSSADGNGLLRTDEKVRINESGTLIVDAGGDAQDIQIISHSAASGHGKIYLRGNASNESSSIQLNHYGHADYHISAGRAANGLFSITRTNGGTDGIVMNANGNVGIKNTGTSSKLHIGDLVSSVSNDINTTHTSLIIKQTNNDNKSGLYIERSGERKGYYMWMNPGGGAGDGLTFTRNNNGTKSDALILDRDANLTVGGHIYPSSNNNYDLGSTANAWRNVYTNDLHLSNMSGSGNDVDGTTGDWTIQEGEENLYIINNRSGKKYKFNLQEVN